MFIFFVYLGIENDHLIPLTELLKIFLINFIIIFFKYHKLNCNYAFYF